MALVAASAQATFHTLRIETLFSNADGSVQFIVLHESAGMPGERFLQGHALTFTRGAVVRSYAFPANLPSDDTAGRRVLVATQGFADLHLIAPDYIIPDRFLATDGGTLDYAGNDQVTYGALPTDGRLALSRTGATVANLAVTSRARAPSFHRCRFP